MQGDVGSGLLAQLALERQASFGQGRGGCFWALGKQLVEATE
jgi:hypothetical protein